VAQVQGGATAQRQWAEQTSRAIEHLQLGRHAILPKILLEDLWRGLKIYEQMIGDTARMTPTSVIPDARSEKYNKTQNR
jgi:hypothetical protein